MDDSIEDTGEVTEVYSDEITATFEWNIPDLSEVAFDICSPTVTYFNVKWDIEINKGDDYTPAHVLLRRYAFGTPIPESIHFSIVSITPDGRISDIARNQIFSENSSEWYHVLPCRIPASGQITLTCTLRRNDSTQAEGVKNKRCEKQSEDTSSKAMSRLSENFKKLLLSGDGHDVVLKVKDKQFRAHKHILKARSPVFAAMFTNDMAESARDSVTIEDFDPDAFGDFLQFVYSGAVDFASVSRALGLYYAADKYDFPTLREMCIQFLSISFTTSTVFEVILLANRYDEEELQKQAIVYFSTHLEEVLLTEEWGRFLAVNPVQANEMYLKAAQCLKSSLHLP